MKSLASLCALLVLGAGCAPLGAVHGGGSMLVTVEDPVRGGLLEWTLPGVSQQQLDTSFYPEPVLPLFAPGEGSGLIHYQYGAHRALLMAIGREAVAAPSARATVRTSGDLPACVQQVQTMQLELNVDLRRDRSPRPNTGWVLVVLSDAPFEQPENLPDGLATAVFWDQDATDLDEHGGYVTEAAGGTRYVPAPTAALSVDFSDELSGEARASGIDWRWRGCESTWDPEVAVRWDFDQGVLATY